MKDKKGFLAVSAKKRIQPFQLWVLVTGGDRKRAFLAKKMLCEMGVLTIPTAQSHMQMCKECNVRVAFFAFFGNFSQKNNRNMFQRFASLKDLKGLKDPEGFFAFFGKLSKLS